MINGPISGSIVEASKNIKAGIIEAGVYIFVAIIIAALIIAYCGGQA